MTGWTGQPRTRTPWSGLQDTVANSCCDGCGAHHEIVANGVFLRDTHGSASERLLVTDAADGMPPPGRILIAGLGVGFSLAAALAHPAVGEVHVVERERGSGHPRRARRGLAGAAAGHAGRSDSRALRRSTPAGGTSGWLEWCSGQ